MVLAAVTYSPNTSDPQAHVVKRPRNTWSA